jgi:hypothetical protein
MQMLIKTKVVMLLMTLSASLAAAPFGYSVTADPDSNYTQSLYLIDLGTGAETRIGGVKLPFVDKFKLDVEGLAFAPDGSLYGVDDDSMTLFPINTDTGQVQSSGEVTISVLPFGGGNDFGMTFACDGNLYLTSIARGSLYRLDLKGAPDLIGPLGVNISALAAYGNPVKLYGLGNGSLGDDGTVDSPNLYEINLTTGAANEIGKLGAAAGSYNEGGLAFDDSGQLWAILESHEQQPPYAPSPSQIVKIDTLTGLASDSQFTSEVGYESLAITVPRGCEPVGNDNLAEFTVQKRFTDGNNLTPVELNISCTTGLPLEQSLTVFPNEGVFGEFEVNFIVKDFVDGELDCEVWEDTPPGYTATYHPALSRA